MRQNSKLISFGYDWHPLLQHIEKITAAYVLALPLGWNQERERQSAGLRTFPIVAMAACGYLLVLTPEGDIAARSRVLQGLVAGIGFIGGGAILRDGATVHGTATAASIWTTGAIGAAVAMDKFEIAAVLSVLNLVTLKGLLPLKKKLDGEGK